MISVVTVNKVDRTHRQTTDCRRSARFSPDERPAYKHRNGLLQALSRGQSGSPFPTVLSHRSLRCQLEEEYKTDQLVIGSSRTPFPACRPRLVVQRLKTHSQLNWPTLN